MLRYAIRMLPDYLPLIAKFNGGKIPSIKQNDLLGYRPPYFICFVEEDGEGATNFNYILDDESFFALCPTADKDVAVQLMRVGGEGFLPVPPQTHPIRASKRLDG